MKKVQILIAVAVFILALFFCLHYAVNDENRLIARVDNEPPELLKNVDNTDETLMSGFPLIDSLFLDYCTHEELFTDVNNSPLIAYIYPSKDTLIVAIWAEYNLGFFLQEEKNQLLAVYELDGFRCFVFTKYLAGIVYVSEEVLSAFLKDRMKNIHKQIFGVPDTIDGLITEYIPITGHPVIFKYKFLGDELVLRYEDNPFSEDEIFIYR